MSKTSKTLKRLGLAALVSAIGAAMVVSVAAAQSPPSPPSRFVGNVTVNGTAVAAGTLIEARIGSTTCGVTTVFTSGAEARYTLDSPALDPSQNPACGIDGSAVAFYIAGQKANETGNWANYRLNTVNLTVSAATTPPTPTKTPAPPIAGTTAGDGGSPAVPMTEVLLVAAALGLAGVGIAARARKA